MAWMYILKCSDDSFYVGSTRDLDSRTEQHYGGGSVHTRTRRPLELIYAEEFDSVVDAYARERQIHGWSRRKKSALVDGRLGDLRRFSSRAGFETRSSLRSDAPQPAGEGARDDPAAAV